MKWEMNSNHYFQIILFLFSLLSAIKPDFVFLSCQAINPGLKNTAGEH